MSRVKEGLEGEDIFVYLSNLLLSQLDLFLNLLCVLNRSSFIHLVPSLVDSFLFHPNCFELIVNVFNLFLFPCKVILKFS